MITQEDLKEHLFYDQNTGTFTRNKTYKHRKAGDICGGGSAGGYRAIKIKGTSYREHRLAWLYVYGVWPKDQLDHINHIRDDNRIFNLREVTNEENKKNRKTYNNNKSGMMGVVWDNMNSKWHSRICINGRSIHLGFYEGKFEAACARKSAEIKHGFHENHGK